MNNEILGAQKQNRNPKCIWTFLIEGKIIYFRVFSYDLEISETFKNATRNAFIRLRNTILIFSGFFFKQFFGSTRIPEVGWWMIWGGPIRIADPARA